MEVIKAKSPIAEAGSALSDSLGRYTDKPILLMLSGGSAFGMLNFVAPDVLGPNVTVMALDERYSTDPLVNNFAQLEQTDFYKECLKHSVKFISTKVLVGESLEELRDRFAAALKAWVESNKSGVIIATMGIGTDGHTAGILPGGYGVNLNGDDWVVGYSVPTTVNQYTQRVTVTNTFLRNQVQEAIVLVTGPEKKELVRELHNTVYGDENQSNKPMRVLLEMKNTSLYTDL